MRIEDIYTREVAYTDARSSIRNAAKLMRTRHVGSLVVVDEPNGERVPIGMITDRDIVLAIVAAEVDPETVEVGDVMSRQIATCAESGDIFDAIETMLNRGVRRLPVINSNGALVGVISSDDIYHALGTSLRELSSALKLGQRHEAKTRPELGS